MSNMNRLFIDALRKCMRIERFEDIEAWQLARELTRKVYGLTKKTLLTSSTVTEKDNPER